MIQKLDRLDYTSSINPLIKKLIMEKKAELAFIPVPAMGHVIPTVELAKKLVHYNNQISISILVMKSPLYKTISSYIHSLELNPTHIRFIDLPPIDNLQATTLSQMIECYKPAIRDAIKNRVNTELSQPNSPRLAGFVTDMMCTTMIDVANEFGVPSYLFSTSNASFLNMMSYAASLMDEHGLDIMSEFSKPDVELDVPGYENLVPTKVLPSMNKENVSIVLDIVRRCQEAKGILVNSFVELESHAFRSLYQDGKIPHVYPVGPIVSLGQSQPDHEKGSTMVWLDNQPPSSVVFLCFGSQGSLDNDQVKEIAIGLQRSNQRFLWSLRRPQKIGERSSPIEYEPDELRDALPDGFLDDTAQVGKVIGWASQAKILAHPSIGAFVSHCGWNSTLESLWFGVPIITWPLYAEQHVNAFQLVGFGLAVDIKTDYQWRTNEQRNSNVMVTAEEVEEGVKKVMEKGEGGEEVKRKAREIKEKSRETMIEGGSSYNSIRKFIDDVINNK